MFDRLNVIGWHEQTCNLIHLAGSLLQDSR